jgi:hypothetical protein
MKVMIKKVKGSRADGVMIPEHGLVGLVDGMAIVDMPDKKGEDFVAKVNGMAKYDVEVLDPKPVVEPVVLDVEPAKEEKPKKKRAPRKKAEPKKEEKPKRKRAPRKKAAKKE